MSGGNAPHQLIYYREQSERAQVVESRLATEVEPSVLQQLFTKVRGRIETLMAEHTFSVSGESPGGLRAGMYTALQDLFSKVEHGNTVITEFARKEAIRLGAHSIPTLTDVETWADIQCNLIVAGERDWWEASADQGGPDLMAGREDAKWGRVSPDLRHEPGVTED